MPTRTSSDSSAGVTSAATLWRYAFACLAPDSTFMEMRFAGQAGQSTWSAANVGLEGRALMRCSVSERARVARPNPSLTLDVSTFAQQHALRTWRL